MTPEHVYFYPEGMITTCDRYNLEMSQFSGRRTKRLLEKVLRAASPTATFHKGPQWHPLIPRAEVEAEIAARSRSKL